MTYTLRSSNRSLLSMIVLVSFTVMLAPSYVWAAQTLPHTKMTPSLDFTGPDHTYPWNIDQWGGNRKLVENWNRYKREGGKFSDNVNIMVYDFGTPAKARQQFIERYKSLEERLSYQDKNKASTHADLLKYISNYNYTETRKVGVSCERSHSEHTNGKYEYNTLEGDPKADNVFVNTWEYINFTVIQDITVTKTGKGYYDTRWIYTWVTKEGPEYLSNKTWSQYVIDGKYIIQYHISTSTNLDAFKVSASKCIQRYDWPTLDYAQDAQDHFAVSGAKKGDCPKNPSLNVDSDGDGVPNYEDLCPKTPTPNRRFMGCPTLDEKYRRLAIIGEQTVKRQIKDFLKCSDLPDLAAKVDALRFVYEEGCENPEYRKGKSEICLPGEQVFEQIVKYEGQRRCFATVDKKLAGLARDKYDDIYHESGHYFADLLGGEDIYGSGFEHEPSKPSSQGTAMSEGRADFLKILMAKFSTRPVDESSFGPALAKTYLDNYPVNNGNEIEGVVTSFLMELLLPSGTSGAGACGAMGDFMKAQRSGTIKGIHDWIKSYLKIKNLSKDKLIAFDQLLKKYKIKTDMGVIDWIDDTGAVVDYYLFNDKFGKLIKKLDLNHKKNSIKVNGSIPIEVFISPKRNFYTRPKGTEYKMDITDAGVITVSVQVGAVEVSPPDQEPLMLYAGQAYTWDPKTDLGKIIDPNTSVNTGGAKADRILETVADSHVYAYSYRNWNKVNWGKYEALGAGWHPDGGEKRAYLKFNLSDINPQSIGKAILKLYHHHTGGANAVDIGVHRVTSSWSEGNGTYKPATNAAPGEITWVNQPLFDSQPVVNFNPGADTNNFVEVDITPLVKEWLSGTPNYGLILMAEGNLSGSTPQSQYGFYSREYENAEKRPVLVLTASSSSYPQTGNFTEPSTTADFACAITIPSEIAFIIAGEALDFAGSAQGFSTDNPSYTWKFGEYGAEPDKSIEQNPGKVTFKFGGSYKAILSVTGPKGRSCEATRDILVYDSNDPREFCEGYAGISIEQNEENKINNCGFTGEHWHSNEYNHQKWCSSVTLDQARNELRDRDQKLRKCTGKGGIANDPSGGGKAQQTVSLEDYWVDKNGHKVSISQNGQNVTATAEENKGPVGWKVAHGEMKGNTVYMNFNGWKLTGKILPQENKISWSNNSIWTRVLLSSVSVGHLGDLDGRLGDRWDVTEVYGWTGIWSRRGHSNVFDALWTLGGKQEKAVLTITIHGTTVNVNRIQNAGYSYPGQECNYKGTLAADNITVTGTYSCAWASGPFKWQAKISGNSIGGIGGSSGEIPPVNTDKGWQTEQKGSLNSINPKAEQWSTSGGGFMIMYGSYQFDKHWYRRTWEEKDPFYLNGEDTKHPPQHSHDEVMKHALIKQGKITVRGPGHLALFGRVKGPAAWVKLYDQSTGNQFHPQSGGHQIMYRNKVWVWENGGWNGSWSGVWTGNVNDLYGKNTMGGWIPAGKILTYDVVIDQGWYNNMNVPFGSMGFGAPQEIDYELWYFPREGGGVKVDDEPTSSGSSISTATNSTKESYSWADWELRCPAPWKLEVSTGAITIGTRKLYRCVYQNLSAPLRTIESRSDGTLASDVYHIVFFTDPKNSASLTSRTVRRLLYNTSEKLGSEALINIYFNDKKDRWESANRQYIRWTSTGNKDEELNYFNLQHRSGIWDSPVKSHTKWYPDGVTAYQHQYEAVENPDHWRSVHISSVSYNPDGRLKMRYEDYLVKQNSDGYWNSFPTHVMSWTGNPSYKNGEFVYKVVQQPSGVWASFETKFLTLNKNGKVVDTRLHEVYFDAACNCYKSRRI
ncbi:MAG: DNRLRE domain-containing protein [Desulfobulbaceae bacterium]|nr:DNRLRE domain-containing protein [Desulfobulbaceae bacterium]